MNYFLPLSNPLYSKSRDLQGLDIAKFICSVLVVSIHVPPFYVGYTRVIFSWISNLCVPFFFVASSWLLFRSANLDDMPTISKKIKGTISRLLIMYLIWTALYSPLMIRELINTDQPLNKFYLLFRNLLFAGSHAQLWYLIASVWGLFIILILLRLGLKPRSIALIALPFFIFGLFCSSYFNLFLNANGIFAKYLFLFNSVRNGLFMGFPLMSLGLLLTTNKKEIKKTTYFIALIAIFVVYMLENAMIKFFDFDYGTNLLVSMPILITVIFYGVIHLKINLSKEVSLILRNLSILIYLSHMYLKLIADSITTLPFLQFIFTTIFCIMFGLLIIFLQKKRPFGVLKYLY